MNLLFYHFLQALDYADYILSDVQHSGIAYCEKHRQQDFPNDLQKYDYKIFLKN